MNLAETSPATTPVAEDQCPSCPHTRSSHDVIAQRFCTATSAGGFSRGCVCGAGKVFSDPTEGQK
ncbi:RGCVC family protein [Amycolatopsis sp. H20-H5]|uniref:RGCVC family protein n=1 Tax=Amycolatopsis sp. H20-H5 TaxID=3046309 RepID=UPI002DB9CE39|nr:RGCVC family protein [Amycolatopsis sp. H20-H5]MEC3980152.1 RGCVC family protein [Amycolatopsis sp. H20-H5]